MEANAEVCKSMQNPLYDLYLKLPGVHPVGQAKIKQFHGIMSNLLAEVKGLILQRMLVATTCCPDL